MKKQILSDLNEAPTFDFTVTDFSQTVLTLSVSQAGFATRLRFLAPDWVKQLRSKNTHRWQYLAQIKVQISPGQKNTTIQKDEYIQQKNEQYSMLIQQSCHTSSNNTGSASKTLRNHSTPVGHLNPNAQTASNISHMLAETANGLADSDNDSTLKKAMERLSRHLAQKQ